ncbi:PTGR1 [Acanthosepion pharaonis]|uniref:Prostaglandin reductase 1 n=1 Tax=Acanthosepion pharaonis TaxID=158019 RepID=A0A812C9G7_ACAPH|nr:PTGR1 [Sepia pharaonis]
MVIAKKWILSKYFEGKPKPSDIQLKTEELPETLNDGEILCEAVWLTVDPYMRFVHRLIKEGDVMFGSQVARVLKSNNSKYPEGTYVLGKMGWCTHSIVSNESQVKKLPEMGDLPLSLALGIMGMPGMTAYFGFLEKCEPKAGEIVLVNGAAGAVGSAVGQIAKIKECKVIAFAGTAEKCTWLKEELGFDHVFNYKCTDLDKALSTVAPKGIDCYFDNVGGDFTSTVLKHMNSLGRVCICGSISTYNSQVTPTGPYPFIDILTKALTIKGFLIYSYTDRFHEGQKEMLEWIQSGLVKYKETMTEGFENMPSAFFGLFEGHNIGKAVVKA